jgi:fermentation-respiration switch protein FrsA (DUF1100 family)
VLVAALGAAFVVATPLIEPAPAVISDAALDLPHEAVSFASDSGSQIKGWFVPAQKPVGVVVLMHGVRANRLSMVGRTKFLHKAGYQVLLFDFQAHGESPGKHITMGFLESRDAQAAVSFARGRAGEGFIGAIGISLGGAAALLGEKPLPVDALVLEAVYPDIGSAVRNRLRIRFGDRGVLLAPLLLLQLWPRLGLGPSDLSPVNAIAQASAPVLMIVGGADRHTTLPDSLRLYGAAPQPKSMWIVPNAAHVDFDQVAGPEYEKHVLSFFSDVRATSADE